MNGVCPGDLDEFAEEGTAFVIPELNGALWRQFVPERPDDPEGTWFDSVIVGV